MFNPAYIDGHLESSIGSVLRLKHTSRRGIGRTDSTGKTDRALYGGSADTDAIAFSEYNARRRASLISYESFDSANNLPTLPSAEHYYGEKLPRKPKLTSAALHVRKQRDRPMDAFSHDCASSEQDRASPKSESKRVGWLGKAVKQILGWCAYLDWKQ